MSYQNRYCCRCHRTTRFSVQGTVFTCSGCGVVVDTAENTRQSTLVGNPMRSFRRNDAA